MKTGMIDYSGSFKLLMSLIDQYNMLYENAGKKIKSGMIRTAEILMKIYGVFLLKEKSGEKKESFRTSNAQLARMQNCSKRTIQRHLERLQLAKILIKRENKGKKSGIELWINLNLLMEKMSAHPVKGEKPERSLTASTGKQSPSFKDEKWQETIENIEKKVFGSDFHEKEQRTKCRHSEEEIINNKINSTVKLLIPAQSTEETGYTGEKDRGPAESVVQNQKEDLAAPGLSRISFVEMFWNLSKKLLYGKTYLSESQHQKALELIAQLYAPVDKEKLQRVHEHYCKRIELVRRYVDRMPEKRFVPLPYIYFDTKNPSGFVGTKKWLQQQIESKREIRKECILLRELSRYKENEKRRDNLKIPQLAMYCDCEKIIKAQNDESLLRRFYEAMRGFNILGS